MGSFYGDSQLIQINSSPVSAFDHPTLPVAPDIITVSPSQLTVSTTLESVGKGSADSGTNERKGLVVVSKGSYLSVLDKWKNLAPILDATLVDLDRSGSVSFFVLCVVEH